MLYVSLITVVLQGGLGDLGNAINMARVIHSPYLVTIDMIVICLDSQYASIKNTLSRISWARWHLLTAIATEDIYRQGDIYHYDIPAPSAVRLSPAIQARLDHADVIIEFPVSYPFLSSFISLDDSRLIRLIEYARTPNDRKDNLIQTGIGKSRQGILFHPKAYISTWSLCQCDPSFLSLLLSGQCLEQYVERHQLLIAYMKPTPKDPNNMSFLRFLFLSVLFYADTAVELDIVTPASIDTIIGARAFFYDYGIRRLIIYHPSGVKYDESLDIGLLTKAEKAQLSSHDFPEKTLRLFSGFTFTQQDFHHLLNGSVVSGNTDDALLFGLCGDGSLTDAMSLSNQSQRVVVPIIKLALPDHEKTADALVAMAKAYTHGKLFANYYSWLVKDQPLDGFQLHELSRYLKERPCLDALKDLTHRLYTQYNLATFIKDYIKRICQKTITFD